MALRTLGARTFRARTFRALTLQVFAIVRRPVSGGGGVWADEYELINLRHRLLREDEEILAIIVAATHILSR